MSDDVDITDAEIIGGLRFDIETLRNERDALKQQLTAAEAELDCYRSTNRTMAAELSTRHDKLADAKVLLREAVKAWDGGGFHEPDRDDWIDRAKEACGDKHE